MEQVRGTVLGFGARVRGLAFGGGEPLFDVELLSREDECRALLETGTEMRLMAEYAQKVGGAIMEDVIRRASAEETQRFNEIAQLRVNEALDRVLEILPSAKNSDEENINAPHMLVLRKELVQNAHSVQIFEKAQTGEMVPKYPGTNYETSNVVIEREIIALKNENVAETRPVVDVSGGALQLRPATIVVSQRFLEEAYQSGMYDQPLFQFQRDAAHIDERAVKEIVGTAGYLMGCCLVSTVSETDQCDFTDWQFEEGDVVRENRVFCRFMYHSYSSDPPTDDSAKRFSGRGVVPVMSGAEDNLCREFSSQVVANFRNSGYLVLRNASEYAEEMHYRMSTVTMANEWSGDKYRFVIGAQPNLLTDCLVALVAVLRRIPWAGMNTELTFPASNITSVTSKDLGNSVVETIRDILKANLDDDQLDEIKEVFDGDWNGPGKNVQLEPDDYDGYALRLAQTLFVYKFAPNLWASGDRRIAEFENKIKDFEYAVSSIPWSQLKAGVLSRSTPYPPEKSPGMILTRQMTQGDILQEIAGPLEFSGWVEMNTKELRRPLWAAVSGGLRQEIMRIVRDAKGVVDRAGTTDTDRFVADLWEEQTSGSGPHKDLLRGMLVPFCVVLRVEPAGAGPSNRNIPTPMAVGDLCVPTPGYRKAESEVCGFLLSVARDALPKRSPNGGNRLPPMVSAVRAAGPNLNYARLLEAGRRVFGSEGVRSPLLSLLCAHMSAMNPVAASGKSDVAAHRYAIDARLAAARVCLGL